MYLSKKLRRRIRIIIGIILAILDIILFSLWVVLMFPGSIWLNWIGKSPQIETFLEQYDKCVIGLGGPFIIALVIVIIYIVEDNQW